MRIWRSDSSADAAETLGRTSPHFQTVKGNSRYGHFHANDGSDTVAGTDTDDVKGRGDSSATFNSWDSLTGEQAPTRWRSPAMATSGSISW
jgi:hypothetical protein